MELKDRLYRILLKEPMDIIDLAQKIGVNYQMLAKVMKHDTKWPMRFLTKLKIEAWIQQKEKELGL
jgi:hypothetical protein